MAREERKPQNQSKNVAISFLNRLCLVCPLSDCFHKSSGCLHRSENRNKGIELIKIGAISGMGE
jgi:hypothetical protein